MTIVNTIAVPYSIMEGYLSGNPLNRISSMAHRYDKIWLISITNPHKESSIFNCAPLVEDGEDRIALQFHDVEGDPEDYDPGTVFFNRDMALKIVEFLKKINKVDSRDLLVVNCHMGISRSGGVAAFAQSVFGIDYSAWKRENPQVNPNSLVMELLFHAWERI